MQQYKSTEYLYGLKAKNFTDLKAIDFLLLRYKAASFLVYKLVWENIGEKRQVDVIKARNWAKQMLIELTEGDILIPSVKDILEEFKGTKIEKEILFNLREYL